MISQAPLLETVFFLRSYFCVMMAYGELLDMGTTSYGFDSMDEVAHQLAVTFGFSGVLYMQGIKGRSPW